MKQVELIDSHVHLTASEYKKDFDDVLGRAIDSGVTRMITIGAGDGIKSAQEAVKLAEKYEYIWATVGIHPHDANTPYSAFSKLRDLAQHPKVVAIGETGLDFYRNLAPEKKQMQWFTMQIELSLQLNKPLIIHSRNAGEACLSVLNSMEVSEVGGVFHCFEEDAAFASKLRSINFLVSFAGQITFKNAGSVIDTARSVPLNQIMIETDGPYLAPEPYRGKRNESAYLIETAKKLAEIKGMSLESLAPVLVKNTEDFFRI